jgi:hypothetical protein
VLCAVSVARIIRPIFFNTSTINSHQYVPHIATPLW